MPAATRAPPSRVGELRELAVAILEWRSHQQRCVQVPVEVKTRQRRRAVVARARRGVLQYRLRFLAHVPHADAFAENRGDAQVSGLVDAAALPIVVEQLAQTGDDIVLGLRFDADHQSPASLYVVVRKIRIVRGQPSRLQTCSVKRATLAIERALHGTLHARHRQLAAASPDGRVAFVVEHPAGRAHAASCAERAHGRRINDDLMIARAPLPFQRVLVERLAIEPLVDAIVGFRGDADRDVAHQPSGEREAAIH